MNKFPKMSNESVIKKPSTLNLFIFIFAVHGYHEARRHDPRSILTDNY